MKSFSNHLSKWGEGPVWWGNTLLYVDIEGHTINRLSPEDSTVETWNVGERVGCVVPTTEGTFIYAGDSGYVHFDPKSGAKTALGNPEAELAPNNRFNDGKCDPIGRLWAGTISLAKITGTANLYCLDANMQIEKKLTGLTNSNGICWSADNERLYHIDTPTKQIKVYEYDSDKGSIGNPHVVVDTEALGIEGSPDGMTIDTKGNLWVAFCHGGCVVCFDPSKGSVVLKIELPCLETTACTFGGPNLDQLFVTTGIHKRIEEVDAGKVFVIEGLGVNGLPAVPFKLPESL